MSATKLQDQPHVERLFRVLFMLNSIRRYTTRDIAEALGISTRTVQRYIEEFRNIGFEIECVNDCYRLTTSSRNNTLINIISGTEEWRLLNNIEEFTSAIKLGKCVRIEGYASGHSATVKDREVEPFEITKDKKYVLCYDPQAGICKTFRPSRCNKVITLDRNWKHADAFVHDDIDIFGFHGTKAIKVKILLDVMAHNLLLEQNKEAALEMTETTQGKWMLSTKVYEIEGVGRFCMGLIGHIEIVDAPELKDYMSTKCDEFHNQLTK